MKCTSCGAPLVQKTRGRTSQYCSDRCRKAGQRKRERELSRALALAPDVIDEVQISVNEGGAR